MTDFIDDILEREGSARTNISGDRGGETQWGLTRRDNPAEWADGQVTRAEARSVFERKYFKGPHIDQIHDVDLQAFLTDWAVHSGPQRAIIYLQEILKVAADGVIGPRTLTAIDAVDAKWLLNQLVGARVRMVGRLITKDPSQAKFAAGWLNRITEFL